MFVEGSRELDYFNSVFISAWKDTNNYKAWICDYRDTINELNPCHPFAGQLSVADMKLKLSQYVHIFFTPNFKNIFEGSSINYLKDPNEEGDSKNLYVTILR